MLEEKPSKTTPPSTGHVEASKDSNITALFRLSAIVICWSCYAAVSLLFFSILWSLLLPLIRLFLLLFLLLGRAAAAAVANVAVDISLLLLLNITSTFIIIRV